jgi:hypothetical protein
LTTRRFAFSEALSGILSSILQLPTVMRRKGLPPMNANERKHPWNPICVHLRSSAVASGLRNMKPPMNANERKFSWNPICVYLRSFAVALA